jgi:hypothetical protein
MGETYSTGGPLIRTDIWSTQLKELLRDELMAQRLVNWMTDFPDGM